MGRENKWSRAGDPAEVDPNPIQWLKDEEIAGAIQAILIAMEPATGLRVDVDSENGIVYLRGEVASEGQKEEAERVARGVHIHGIREIRNELRVNPFLPPLPHP